MALQTDNKSRGVKANQSNSSFEADLAQAGFNPFSKSGNRSHREIFDDSVNISEIKYVSDSPNQSNLGPVELKADMSSESAKDQGDKKASTAKQRVAQRRERKANPQSAAMSDILKEASMIKESWQDTLKEGGIIVQEKADPNMTETKDSENISQGSPELNQSNKLADKAESPEIKPSEANFSKKPKQTAMETESKIVKTDSRQDEKAGIDTVEDIPAQADDDKPQVVNEEPAEVKAEPVQINEKDGKEGDLSPKVIENLEENEKPQAGDAEEESISQEEDDEADQGQN